MWFDGLIIDQIRMSTKWWKGSLVSEKGVWHSGVEDTRIMRLKLITVNKNFVKSLSHNNKNTECDDMDVHLYGDCSWNLTSSVWLFLDLSTLITDWVGRRWDAVKNLWKKRIKCKKDLLRHHMAIHIEMHLGEFCLPFNVSKAIKVLWVYISLQNYWCCWKHKDLHIEKCRLASPCGWYSRSIFGLSELEQNSNLYKF